MFKIKEGLKLFNNQTTVRYPTGNYGSFEIDGGAKGSYEGYSIGGRVTFMHDNGTATGLYDDVNNKWMLLAYLNGETRLYHSGTQKLATKSGGVTVNGTLTADSLVGSINYNQISNPPSIPSTGNFVTTNTTQIVTGTKDFISTANHYSGHFYYDAYDANGMHYPHFLDGSGSTGVRVNWRIYNGSSLRLNTWDYNYNDFHTNVRAPIFYDSNNTAYYADPASTSNFSVLNANTLNITTLNATNLSVSGNTTLGNGNGDTTRVNDILYVQATDSGDAHFHFGENSTNGYGAYWHWDSGYRMTLNSRNAGTNTAVYYFDTNSTTYLNMGRHIHMQNKDINYVNQLHFNDNVRFYDDGNDNYLNFKWGDAGAGGIKFYDGNTTLQGFVYGDGSGRFGLLDNDSQWAVRIQTGTDPLELRCNNNPEFYVYDSYTYSPGSSRAPIFYDSDNTGYYVDPDTGSESLVIRGSIRMEQGNTCTKGIELNSVKDSTWPFEFTTNDVGNDNSSGFWVGSNGYPDMRLRRDSGTVVALISSWEESYVSNGFRVEGTSQLNGNLYVGTGTSSNIYMRDSDHGNRRIHCNSNRIGFLNEANGWGSYCGDGGDWYSDQSIRSPIFYDSNDTGRYLNPASDSRLNKVRLYNRLSIGSNSLPYEDSGTGEAGVWLSGSATNATWFLGLQTASSSAPLRFYAGADRFTFTRDGHGTASGSYRAPIFYDSNNTSYYGDFASNSSINQLRTVGHISVGSHGDSAASTVDTTAVITFGSLTTDAVNNYSIGTRKENYGGNYNKLDLAFHTGIRLGAHPNYGGVRFFSDQSMGTEIASIGKSGNFIVGNNSVRSPIFYDSNNTGYYTNPASTSVLNALTVNTINGYSTGDLQRIVRKTNGTAGAGWMTVADCTSARHHGEIYVTDGESSDHSFIRIDWMRSYADSNFTVLNVGGHSNRITAVRVLTDGDITYGRKVLQVYVTASSNYYVRILTAGDTPNYGTPNAVTPVIQNSISGYPQQGSTVDNLEKASLGTDQGIRVGGEIRTPTMWVNHSTGNYNGYNENIRLFPAANSVSVIAFGATGDSGEPWQSILGYSDRLETRYRGTWEQRQYSGYVEARGSSRAPIFYDSNDTNYYTNPASTSRMNAIDFNSGTLRGSLVVPSNKRGYGMFGTYSSTKTQSIWSMGTAYRSNDSGTNFGNLYGLAYKHTNNGTGGTMAGGHMMVWCQDGTPYAAMGSNIWTSGNVTAYSDRRVKTNLELIPNALEKVQKLNGYTFDRTDVKHNELGEVIGAIRQTGVVAQEVLEVLPEAVTGSEEEHYSVAYGNMVGLLIEAIKEQQTQIEELSSQLNSLKEK